jgi:acyl-CoA synthetase (AMP-forming)/AMP-acid ligase II
MPDFLRYMEQFKVTSMIIVPPQVVAMVNAAKDDEAFVRKCLRYVHNAVGGAAPLDAETQGKLQALMPKGSAFTQLWAMTETTCIASYFYHPEQNLTASVGQFVPNIDVKLVNPDPDSDGEEVGPYDVRGELCVRGPTVIRGYLDNPEANARDWDNEGYFRTGDILYCDSKTKLWYVVDRRKELIKVRGFQVAPNEIEGVLLAQPDIRDAAVIGITEGKAGELPRGYVVTKPGAKLTEKEVNNWVGARLARYKQLEAGVKFVESIPKTVSGKILKRILREEAKREMGAKL